MKKLIFILCFLSIFANAEEIKLTCQANYQRSINGVNDQNRDGNIEVTIIEQTLDKIFRTIFVKGITTQGVSTIPSENTLKQGDFSNQNRWEVSSKQINITENMTESTTTIEINRNTGSINIHSDSIVIYAGKKNLVQEDLIGICSKVDTSKKKF